MIFNNRHCTDLTQVVFDRYQLNQTNIMSIAYIMLCSSDVIISVVSKIINDFSLFPINLETLKLPV